MAVQAAAVVDSQGRPRPMAVALSDEHLALFFRPPLPLHPVQPSVIAMGAQAAWAPLPSLWGRHEGTARPGRAGEGPPEHPTTGAESEL